MRHEIVDKKLVFHLEGELNSYNAEEVEKKMEEAIALGGFEDVCFDLNNLRYMSSAGLRIVARMNQQFEGHFSLINMPDDIYEVFVMVGFNELLDIKRKK